MATKFSSTLLPSNAADANFRAWVTFIHELFTVTGGWVQTADTGQANPATITTGGITTANTKFGYTIYRMNDALQATTPVFIRVDFGNGTTASVPGMWFTIGQSTDGSGNITNVRTVPSSSAVPTSGGVTTTGTHTSYGSANVNRISAGLFNISTSSIRILGFTIERTHDANGNDTPYGLIVTGTYPTTIATRWGNAWVVVLAPIGQPPIDEGLNYILPSANPGTYGSDAPVGVHVPSAGVALYPSKEVCAVKTSDFAAEGAFSMTLYGSSINYQLIRCNTRHAVTTSGTGDASCSPAIRYE